MKSLIGSDLTQQYARRHSTSTPRATVTRGNAASSSPTPVRVRARRDGHIARDGRDADAGLRASACGYLQGRLVATELRQAILRDYLETSTGTSKPRPEAAKHRRRAHGRQVRGSCSTAHERRAGLTPAPSASNPPLAWTSHAADRAPALAERANARRTRTSRACSPRSSRTRCCATSDRRPHLARDESCLYDDLRTVPVLAARLRAERFRRHPRLAPSPARIPRAARRPRSERAHLAIIGFGNVSGSTLATIGVPLLLFSL